MEFKRPTRQQRPVHRTTQQISDFHTVDRPLQRHDAPQPGQNESHNHSNTPPKSASSKTIDINIKLGRLPKLPSKTSIVKHARNLLASKRAIATSIVGVVIVGSLTASAIIQNQHAVNQSMAGTNSPLENIEYQTVLPAGKTISELGGWKRVSPPEGEPVYAYIDTIDGVSINVSQQPLPESSKTTTDDHIADIAKKFNATTKLNAGSTKMYIGTSAQGPQSAILSKNGLLILIKSQKKVADKSWTAYAESLQ